MSSILSAREQEMVCLIWQTMKSTPEIDLDKLALKSGHKTRASANTAFHKLKNKMSAFGKGKDDAEDNDADADADAEGDAEDTPAPVVKKARGKKAAVVKAEEPETDEDDEPETVPVKSRTKPKAKASKVAASKAAKPAAKGRNTRASLKARQSITKDESSDDSDDGKKGLTLKTGPARYPKIEDIMIVSTASDAVDDPAVVPEEVTAEANVLKRAATEPASDIDELADTKRVKLDVAVDTPVDTTPTVVSADPLIESFVVNDTDAVDISADISMTAEDVEDASGVSDVRSDVASAADSGDRDIWVK